MATRIVFSDGASVSVDADLERVHEALEAAQWAMFEKPAGGQVFVNREKVAYIESGPGGQAHFT
jgi:hypothetical protein